jgi:polar amino acid transport system substrate-binding protein
MRSWFLFMLLWVWSAGPLQAAEIFCYDAPADKSSLKPVLVGGQHIYGAPTARIAGWVLQVLPQATFVELPWQRCLNEVRAGRIDGLLSLGWTEERAKWYTFPPHAGQPHDKLALFDVPYFIYVLQDSAVRWDGQQFHGLQYGLITFKGYVAEQRLRDLNALAPLDLDISQAVDLLVNRRVDGYVIPPGTTAQQFSQHPKFAQVRQLAIPLLQMPLYLAFATQYCQVKTEVCERVWTHLAAQRQSWEAAERAAAEPQ